MPRHKRIDRRKSEADIVEHVVEGVRAEAPDARVRVTDLGVRPWLAGEIYSAVQVEFINRSRDTDRQR